MAKSKLIKLNNYVCPVLHSLRLKDLGIDQSSAFFYNKQMGIWDTWWKLEIKYISKRLSVAAFTLEEIKAMLGDDMSIFGKKAEVKKTKGSERMIMYAEGGNVFKHLPYLNTDNRAVKFAVFLKNNVILYGTSGDNLLTTYGSLLISKIISKELSVNACNERLKEFRENLSSKKSSSSAK